MEHICDNASVYFQDLDREIIKHMDIAVLRSEIVQGNTIAGLCKCCGNGLQADIVYCADSFCNLNGNKPVRNTITVCNTAGFF